MLKIAGITEFSKAKTRIIFDDESFLVVYKGMYKGSDSEMKEEEYDTLVSEMTSYGKKRAMNLLIKKDYSVKALKEKLEEDGYNSSIIEKIFTFLNGYHYLDDNRLAENLIRANKEAKSKAEIRFMLKKRGISEETAERALEEYYVKDEDDPEGRDPELKAVIYLLKKMSLTPDRIAALDFKEKQKLAAKFYRKGFRSDVISKALKLENFE